MNDKLKDFQVDFLFSAILELRSEKECYNFFCDLCTASELKSMSQRMQVALLLDQKKTYSEISERTSASAATISRVNRSLEYGEDGYRMVLERLKKISRDSTNEFA